MWEFGICVLEVIIVLLALKIVYNMNERGRFSGEYVSDPSIAAAIGNAANRKFENTQAAIMGSSDKGMMSSRGYMKPEDMVWMGGR